MYNMLSELYHMYIIYCLSYLWRREFSQAEDGACHETESGKKKKTKCDFIISAWHLAV